MPEHTDGCASVCLPQEHPLARIAETIQEQNSRLVDDLRCALPDPAFIVHIAQVLDGTRRDLIRAWDAADRVALDRQVAVLNEEVRRVEQVREGMLRALDLVTRIGPFRSGAGMRQAYDALAGEASMALAAHDTFAFLRAEIAEQKEAAEAFRDSGWPIAPSMSPWLIAHVVEMHRQGRTRYATQAIVRYYRRSDCRALAECVDRWRLHPLLGPRISIFEDALAAHRERKYTLSVPALGPQLEGVAMDYVLHNGLHARLGHGLEVCKTALGNLQNRSLDQWAIAETLLYQLETNQYAYVDFQAQMRLPPRDRAVSRHTVAHGTGATYYLEIHSLHQFLLLDAMSALI